jgi:hypothetical protein
VKWEQSQRQMPMGFDEEIVRFALLKQKKRFRGNGKEDVGGEVLGDDVFGGEFLSMSRGPRELPVGRGRQIRLGTSPPPKLRYHKAMITD